MLIMLKNSILGQYFKFLPSRLLVIINSLFIAPLIIYNISSKEMGVFKLSLALLSLVCTFSSDWICKTVIRFYFRYKAQNILNKYYYNLSLIFFLNYLLIVFAIICLRNQIITYWNISSIELYIILLLLIPTGIREFLFQLLRALNKPYIYAITIFSYQILFIFTFFILLNRISNNLNLLLSMILSMISIDIILLFLLKEPFFSKRKNLDKPLIKECISYSLPIMFTGLGIWLITNSYIFILQHYKDYHNLGTISAYNYFISSTILPFISLFPFSILPAVLNQSENKKNISTYINKSLEIYLLIYIPLFFLFLYYAKNIYNLIFHTKYPYIWYLLPFFIMAGIILNFTKIINFKYHIERKTYIDMFISCISGLFSVLFGFLSIKFFNIAGAIITLLVSIILYLILNLCVSCNISYDINYVLLIKTIILISLICCFNYKFINILLKDLTFGKYIEPILYIILSYFSSIKIYLQKQKRGESY